MKQRTFKQKVINQSIALGVLTVVLIVLSILKNNQTVCEFFATTFSRAWIFLFGNLFGILPFSLYEVFLVCAIGGAVVFLVFVVIMLVKRRWQQLVSLVLAVALGITSFVNLYTVTASFAYNRKPLPQNVYSEYSSQDFSYEDAVALAEIMVERLNFAYNNTQHDPNGQIVYPYAFGEICNLLQQEYERLDGQYFSAYTPKAKRITNKWIMSQMHITGVFFAPFGEANVNGNEKGMYLPVTMAHEMAHGKGVMREYQADIVAYYVTLTSDNPYLSYGALASLTFTALHMLTLFPTVQATEQYPRETMQRLSSQIDNGIFDERVKESEFWSKFTLLDDVGEFFNNLYLLFQNQEGGTDSYVKPGETVGTGQTDDAGEEIYQVISFSGTQNLLITLYKQGLLTVGQ